MPGLSLYAGVISEVTNMTDSTDNSRNSRQMNHEQHPSNEIDTLAANWQRDLQQQLIRLQPYLMANRIVTFAHITVEEKSFFEWLVNSVRVPEPVCGVFIPPSVVQQAMWPDSRRSATDDESGIYGVSPDAGAVVAIRCGELSTIVNALFAFPPLSPGIDVYQGGRILAGYTYSDHAECANGLSEAMHTFLA